MNARGRFGSKPGLGRICKLLSALGHPERNYKCILVAGTNGKGSTTAFLAAALSAPRSGRRPRVGSYFSPHLFSFCERIRVNGKNISKKELLAAARPVLSLLPSMRDDPPTFFEAVTAIALLHFARAEADFAVLEAGLGGSLDATNAVQPVLSVITSIGLEHTDVLGRTTKKIAREKAGIMRPGVPAVSGVRERAARKEIQTMARRLRAPLREVFSPVRFPLRASGSYQPFNAALAHQSALLLSVSPPAARRAISRTTLAGRWQTISHHPRVIVDCAHNPPAVEKIQPDLLRDFKPRPSSPRVLLFAAMADKNYPAMLRSLAPHFDSVVLCRPPFARAAKLADLKKAARRAMPRSKIYSIPRPSAAWAFSRRIATVRGRVLVCGSIYLLSALWGEKEFKLAS